MAARNELAAFGLFLLGIALLVAGGWGAIGNGPVGTALSVLGFALLGAAALWTDVFEGGSVTEPDADRRKLLVNAASAVGVVLFLSIAYTGLLPDRLRVVLGGFGLVILLTTGYWHRRWEMTEEFDEREVRIRYRAAYNGFLAVYGLLIVGTFVAFALAPPDGDAVSPVTMTVTLGVLVIMLGGGLAFKLSEGWYRTRM